MMRIRTYTALLAVSAASAVLAAGCGGGDETSGPEAWADGVCSAVVTWKDSMTEAADSLQQGDGEIGDRVDAALEDAQNATEELADDLEGLGRPETEAGQEAETALDTLADGLSDGIDAIQQAAGDAEGGTGALTAISTISATLAAMAQQVQAVVAQLEALDPQGELADAFRESDSCAELRS